jgi:hypothetical protein
LIAVSVEWSHMSTINVPISFQRPDRYLSVCN